MKDRVATIAPVITETDSASLIGKTVDACTV
jgi:hypothetical protein